MFNFKNTTELKFLKFEGLPVNQRIMPDIIEVDLRNPYFKLNYPLILKKMEEGAIVIFHQRQYGVVLSKTLGKKYQYGFTAQADNTWKMFIKKGKVTGEKVTETLPTTRIHSNGSD